MCWVVLLRIVFLEWLLACSQKVVVLLRTVALLREATVLVALQLLLLRPVLLPPLRTVAVVLPTVVLPLAVQVGRLRKVLPVAVLL